MPRFAVIAATCILGISSFAACGKEGQLRGSGLGNSTAVAQLPDKQLRGSGHENSSAMHHNESIAKGLERKPPSDHQDFTAIQQSKALAFPPPPYCVGEHKTCGGSGQVMVACCAGMQCQQYLGGYEMRCVRTLPSCVSEGQVCGGPGQLTQQCCGDLHCHWQGEQMRCIDHGPACVSKGQVCGGPGQLMQQCCGDLRCHDVGVQMRCVDHLPQDDYITYFNKNAYAPYGAMDIDSDRSAPSGLTVQQCQDRCTRDLSCSCVTYARESGQCWRRAYCNPNGWTSSNNNGFNVYLKALPQDDYITYFNKNAYAPYGAMDIDSDRSAPSGLTVQQCQDRCTRDLSCSCVTYKRESGKCWRRAYCNPYGWTSSQNNGFNVYLKASP